MIMHQQQTQMEKPSNEELCNLLVQGLIAKDEKLLCKVLEEQEEDVIKDIIIRVPVNHVRKLIIELTNILSTDLTPNHLQWLQHILALKYSVVSSMADGRSILLPLVSLLDDKSSPAYYNKMQSLKGKLTLLRHLKEARKVDVAETIVKVREDREQPAQMEVESETDTESEEDFDDEVSDLDTTGQAEGMEEDDDEDEEEEDDDDDIVEEAQVEEDN